ncbi:unnamed protein product [Durusdinium trenchii]|uniref:Glycosyltransferase 2-like domain-containing protein n=1 Tax=Durusdinium trenchii TaxID=1381693 RepID=A0ABP0PY41_9DINO
MCKRCPGFPGTGTLYWPLSSEEQAAGMAQAYPHLPVRCGRCGCPGHQHQNLEPWLADVKDRAAQMRHIVSWYRPLPPEPHLPMAAAGWSRTSAALFVLTNGIFDPRRRLDASKAKPLISVVAPTSFSRQGFHPLLYDCFCRQEYHPKELVVVDTGPEPSSFFQERVKEDPRIIYRHFCVADSRLDLPEGWKKGAPVHFGFSTPDLWSSRGLRPSAWSLGMKRNVAIELSAGEIIAHFDDDDLYAEGYLTWMSAPRRMRMARMDRLQQVLEKSEPVTSEHIESTWAPAAITLKAWHLLDLSDMTFGFMDVEKDPLLPKDQRYGWLYGWGFSYVFTRACWELTPVPDVEWSEDISFYEELRRLKEFHGTFVAQADAEFVWLAAMMSSRLVALAILGAWSVSLQGCSEKKPEPKTSCSIKTSSVALAATKPCNKSIPSKTLETPDVVVKTMQDEKGFVEMQLQIGNNTFKTADRSSFASSPKNLTQVPVVPVRPERVICAHSYHAKVNTSGGEFSGAVRCGEAIWEAPTELLDLLPLAEEAAKRVAQHMGSELTVADKSGFRVNLSEKKACRSAVRADAAAFNALATRANSWTEAFYHFTWARHQGITCTSRSLRSACASGVRWPQGLELLTLFDAMHMRLDMVAFSATAHGAVAVGQWTTVLDVLLSLQFFKLETSAVLRNTAVNALSKTLQWQRSLQAVRAATFQQLRPDLFTLSTLLSGLPWSWAMTSMEEVSPGVRRNVQSWGALLGTFAPSALWEMAISTLRSIPDGLNLTMMNIILSALEKGSRWQGALTNLQAGHEQSLQVDSISLNSALMSCRQVQKWAEAMSS